MKAWRPVRVPERRTRAACVIIAGLLGVVALGAQTSPLRARMIAAEDARVATAAGIAPLLDGLRSRDPALIIVALRGLGRFEQPMFVERLLPFLTHARADVRREAANALGQSVAGLRGDTTQASASLDVALVTRSLLTRLGVESDPGVRGVIAETLGRLPYQTVEAMRRTEEVLRSLLPPPDGDKPAVLLGAAGHTAVLTGAIKGLESLLRLNRTRLTPDAMTMERIQVAATRVADPSDADFARIRRIAWAAMSVGGTVDAALLVRGMDDTDPQVRRLATAALASPQAPGQASGPTSGQALGRASGLAPSSSTALLSSALARMLTDSSPLVRYEAIRTYARTELASNCVPVLRALGDAEARVVLAAIDALGEPCPREADVVPALIGLADALPVASGSTAAVAWHRAAHAMVSLARIRREAATPRLSRFAEYPVWQVRMYAARAATVLAATARLERLAMDTNANVRNEAITGLKQVSGHDADAVFIDALGGRDYQLVLTAARALQGTPNPDRAREALLRALTRISAERSETSRDTRVALIDRLAEIGSRQQAAALQSCLSDFDAVVARACARTLKRWTGSEPTVHPRPLPRMPVDGSATRATIILQGGRRFELRLLPEEAPNTVATFARLARQGYYNGSSFQRVVPDFVIQGGGPGANEYSGAPRFMRDEVGLTPHVRGSVGISTRGRDTGDAQIFIDLVDNPRLDHEYTVFAQVASGMDVVERVLEGDVIERIDVAR